MVARALRQRGYVVLAGASGADCLRLLEAHRGAIDLVLTDVVISDTSGKALYEAVAARRPGVPVLYMSGYPDETIAPHGVLAPGTHFLQKPFTGQGLLAKMQEVLGVAG
jgi:DNA-binding NtrC family response regulator